ncbi:MAG: ATP-binding protein [Bacteroides sp.]|nr:ATP-binding protein [Bacteroides sp.]
MNNTQLYYSRIIETFVEEYRDQLMYVKEGHCMKVVGLPFDVLENLYDELRALGSNLRIFILSEDKEGSRYISATKLIELRNDLTQSILVLIPVNVSTAAEDSYGNATFKELSIAHLNDKLLYKLMKEVETNETVKQILTYLTESTPKQKVLDYLLYIIEKELDNVAIGVGIFKMGFIPDSEIAHDLGLIHRRMSINSECIAQLVDYSKSIIDRVDNLPILPNTIQREITTLLQRENRVNNKYDLCEIIATNYPDLDFSKWENFIKGIDVTSLGNLKIISVSISSKNFGTDDDGDLTMPIQANKPAKIKVRIQFSPKPKAFPDLQKIRIALMNVDGMYCEYDRLKIAKVSDNARDYRDVTISIKPNDFNSGRYFLRVFGEDEHGTVLNLNDDFKDPHYNDLWEEEKESISKEEFIEKYRAFLTSDSESFYIQTVESGDKGEDTIQDSRRMKINNVLQAYFHYRIESCRKGEELLIPERMRITDKEDKGKGEDRPWQEGMYWDTFRIKYSHAHNFQILLSRKLLQIERCILKYSDKLGYVEATLSSNYTEKLQHLQFNQFDSIEVPPTLIAKRVELFQLIKNSATDASGVVETFDVFSHIDELKTYVTEYQAWLKSIIDNGVSGDNAIRLQNLDLVDIISPLPDGQTARMKLLSPLHPVRLSWLINIYELYNEWEQKTIDNEYYREVWYKKLDQLFYGDLVPSVAPLIIRGSYSSNYLQYVGEIMFGWGLYVNSADQKDDTFASGFRQLRSYLSHLLNIPMKSRIDTDVNAEMVHRYMYNYITQHPYTDKLVINLFNAGDAAVFASNLVALEKKCRPFDIHYEIRLFCSDKRFLQGEAFRDLIDPDTQVSEDAEMFSQSTSNRLFPKLRFSINTVDDFVNNAHDYPAHLSFLINPFPTEAKLHKPSTIQQSFYLNGVVCRPIVQVTQTEKGCQWQRFYSDVRLPHPSDEFANETIGLFAEYQSLVAMSMANDRDSSVPALMLDIEDTNSVMLSRIHDVSDWVITFDKNMGPEFYDIPCGEGEIPYLLDYIPSTELTGISSFLTCRPTSEIESILTPHFKEFGIDISDRERFYDFLADIRSVSSSMIMQLNSSRNKVFEVLGTTLMKRLLKGKDLLTDSFIIPIDLHQDIFNYQLISELATKERADNVLVDIHPSTGEIVFTIIEIKCRQKLSDDQREDLQEKMNEQISNTEKALKFQFDPRLEILNLDHELKIIELQSLLLFYLRRAHRYGYICEESFNESEKFILRLTKDNYSLKYKRLGLIFEFQSETLQNKEVMYTDDAEITFYTMGKPMIDRILAKDTILKTTGLYSSMENEANLELTQFFEVSERTKRDAALKIDDNSEMLVQKDSSVSGYKNNDSAEPSQLMDGSNVSYGNNGPLKLDENKVEVPEEIEEIISTENHDPETITEPKSEPKPKPEPEPVVETVETQNIEPQEVVVTPIENDVEIPHFEIMIGKTSAASPQYGILGKTINGNRSIGIDLTETNTISLFGVQGGGKSYTIGTITEMTLKQFDHINLLPAPMASVIFHYSESMDYEPEFTSMIYPNDEAGQLAKLKEQYGAEPNCIEDVLLLTPFDKVEERQEEYPSIKVMPISFHSKDLNVQDWMFLLKAVGNDSTYISQLKSIMRANRKNLNLKDLRESVESSGLLTNSQKSLAMQRLNFAEEYVTDEQRLGELLKPGRLIIVDLRDEFIEKDDALGLFVIMLNIFSSVKQCDGKSFNKFIVFDEAHKYMNNKDLTGTIVTAIREMRHRGVSIMIASQDPMSLPTDIIELSTIMLMHRFNSPQWVKHIQHSITQLQSLTASDMAALTTGEAYLWATKSTDKGVMNRPIKITTRPRVTKHGGDTIKAL